MVDRHRDVTVSSFRVLKGGTISGVGFFWVCTWEVWIFNLYEQPQFSSRPHHRGTASKIDTSTEYMTDLTQDRTQVRDGGKIEVKLIFF